MSVRSCSEVTIRKCLFYSILDHRLCMLSVTSVISSCVHKMHDTNQVVVVTINRTLMETRSHSVTVMDQVAYQESYLKTLSALLKSNV